MFPRIKSNDNTATLEPATTAAMRRLFLEPKSALRQERELADKVHERRKLRTAILAPLESYSDRESHGLTTRNQTDLIVAVGITARALQTDVNNRSIISQAWAESIQRDHDSPEGRLKSVALMKLTAARQLGIGSEVDALLMQQLED